MTAAVAPAGTTTDISPTNSGEARRSPNTVRTDPSQAVDPSADDRRGGRDSNGDTPREGGGNEGAGADVKHPHGADLKTKVVERKDKITKKTESIRDKTNPPGGHDATPLPRTSRPGYTVRFTFHRASNLPVADAGSSSSDPFVHATLTTNLPTRHKEDPEMVHRTRTVHKSTEPVWDDEWIVANVPPTGFRLKCRLYDEDSTSHNDRLGSVTYAVPRLDETWPGLDHTTFDIKKRMGSKRAYLLKAATWALRGTRITGTLELSIQVLGKSDPPAGRVYTIGPTGFVRHFSPMIGRIFTKTLVNKDERADEDGTGEAVLEANGTHAKTKDSKETKKYDFQANEIQLQGPVPEKLYHRYVEFRPIIGRMFSSHGLRGRILNKVLHKQHNRVYNYSRTTEYGTFPACSEQASLQFLKMAHFDEGGRIFTYVLSLDGVLRFTETGKEFGIDLLSKHTMHADVATYTAFSGEFFIRRLAEPSGTADPVTPGPTHPSTPIPGGPPLEPPPHQPGYYQLIIDNDSGTYRPDKSLLPLLKEFLAKNFPGLGIAAMHWEDKTLQDMKKAQHESKKSEGPGIQMVINHSPSNSSLSSSDESRLSDMEHGSGEGGEPKAGHHESGGGHGRPKTKKETALELLEDPRRIKDLHSTMYSHSTGESAAEAR
ncbi:c2 domain containing protein [Niveomyces insectorum RCEF 264]|uniref:C2 domain containing protein n=1 Tax=Niveomyces insectorum RCEF 264 TaxID=1081102 RepID=A0A167STH9_9HYPO|nr:c2 domain containing protein [Niveomyces insectorum RCEF 264]